MGQEVRLCPSSDPNNSLFMKQKYTKPACASVHRETCTEIIPPFAFLFISHLDFFVDNLSLQFCVLGFFAPHSFALPSQDTLPFHLVKDLFGVERTKGTTKMKGTHPGLFSRLISRAICSFCHTHHPRPSAVLLLHGSMSCHRIFYTNNDAKRRGKK